MCTWASLTFPPVAMPNVWQSPQVSGSLHSRTLCKWPYSKSQTESARISSTLWPHPQIIDICFISITVSPIWETIQIFSGPKWVSPLLPRILFPSVAHATLFQQIFHVFPKFQPVLLSLLWWFINMFPHFKMKLPQPGVSSLVIWSCRLPVHFRTKLSERTLHIYSLLFSLLSTYDSLHSDFCDYHCSETAQAKFSMPS